MRSKLRSKVIIENKKDQQNCECTEIKMTELQKSQRDEQKKNYKALCKSVQLRNEKKYLYTISTEKNLASDELKQNRGKEENSERLAVNDIKINQNSKLPILKKKRQFFTCPKCLKKFNTRFKCSFDCLHYFCEDCIQNHIIHSTERIQRIVCPSNKCEKVLEIKSSLFLSLPLSIQDKIKQNWRKENIIENSIDLDQILRKQRTQHKIKQKQQNDQHTLYRQKTQDSYNILISTENFKTCGRCKRVGSKKFNDNRILCECGFIFCYKCGQDWGEQGHICSSLSNATAQKLHSAASNQKCIPRQKQKQKKKNCKERIRQIFFTLIWILVIVVIQIPKFTIAAILTAIAAFIAGMTFFACVFICNQDRSYKTVLLLLFFPFALLVGIGIALINFFSFLYSKEVQFYYAVKFCFFDK